MKTKGVLFDFDGVIVKSMEMHLEAWQSSFKKYNVDISQLELYELEGSGVNFVANFLAKKHKVDPIYISDIIDSKIEYYDNIFKPIYYDGFFDLVDSLKNNKLKMAIVSGGMRSRLISFVNQYLSNYFSAIVSSDDVTHTKPSPEPYLKGAQYLNLDTRDCIVIENAPMGIQSGKNAGMKVIAITTTMDEKYLSEADYIVHTFKEVQEIISTMVL